jgi:hypothetical protein
MNPGAATSPLASISLSALADSSRPTSVIVPARTPMSPV